MSRDLTADMTADRVEEAYEDVVIDLCDPNTCGMDEHRVCEAETGKYVSATRTSVRLRNVRRERIRPQ